MTKQGKTILYSAILCVDGFIMLSLLFNNFMALIIVPFVAWGWALVVLVGFIRDRKRFAADIASDKDADWNSETKELKVVWEEEPHDIEWKFETIAIYGFTALIVIYWISGLMAR